MRQSRTGIGHRVTGSQQADANLDTVLQGLAMLKAGLTHTVIAKRCRVPTAQVQHWAKHYLELTPRHVRLLFMLELLLARLGPCSRPPKE
jgi:hypothetical protein